MRLIDADALADALFEKRKDYPQWVADAIGNMPDAIVRCKDCHYGIRNSKEDIFCIKAIYNDKYKRPDWYCADGERKDT